jgi:hypothetical protein
MVLATALSTLLNWNLPIRSCGTVDRTLRTVLIGRTPPPIERGEGRADGRELRRGQGESADHALAGNATWQGSFDVRYRAIYGSRLLAARGSGRGDLRIDASNWLIDRSSCPVGSSSGEGRSPVAGFLAQTRPDRACRRSVAPDRVGNYVPPSMESSFESVC